MNTAVATALVAPAIAKPIRVMVVDDHPMWRDAVARDLAEAGYDVVATAADGAQALRVAAAARPDVVVLDLQLPDMSGVEVTRGLRAAHPAARVLVLSASGEQQDVLDAVKAGRGRGPAQVRGPGRVPGMRWRRPPRTLAGMRPSGWSAWWR